MRRPSTARPLALDFPDELSPIERYHWTMLMRRTPPGHFTPADMPAIVQYCRLTTIESRLYARVRDGEATAAEITLFTNVAGQVRQLYRLLRIGPSTRNQRDRKGSRDDAFDPQGAHWSDLLSHGRGGTA